jgi:hypothetical protein
MDKDKDEAAVGWEIGTARADSVRAGGLEAITGATMSTADHRRGCEVLGCAVVTSAWHC